MRNEQEYVYMVYQKGSFSKAAQALYLTQPALSIAIQRIEQEIGMPLFDRNQKPLGLTEAGRIYIEKLRQMRILEKELESQLMDLTSMNTGHVRIGGSSYMISCILAPVLLQFKKKYPGIKLDIVESGAYELKEMLRDQKLDLTFISRQEKEDPFVCHPAFQDLLLLAVPAAFPVHQGLEAFSMTWEDVRAKRHLDPDRPCVDLRVFQNISFIVLEAKYNLRQRANVFFKEAGISPYISMEVAQIVTAYALTQAGLGAAFVPDRAVVRPDQNTFFYKIDSPQTVRKLYIVTHNRSYISLATERFIDMFKTYYQQEIPIGMLEE